MFKRKKPLTTLQQGKELLWPSMGWQRAWNYIKLRVMRLPHSSKSVAAGLAIGVSVSFSPFMGTHIMQGMLIAYIFRVSTIAAMIGTVVGNPWTFPFIWWASISLGAYLFELMGLPASTNIPVHMDLMIFWDVVQNDPLRILLPWALGGYLIAFLSWPVSYLMFYNAVRATKLAKTIKKRKK